LNPFLFVLRDDLQGGQRLKAFMFQGDNLKQVLDAPGKRFHVRFQEGSGPLEVLSSSKEVPAGKKDAERSYRWDAGAGMFSGADPSKPVVASAGKEKAPAGMPPAEKAPQEIEIAASAGAPPAGPADMEPAASPAPKAAFAALKAEIPGLIQKGQIAVVGQKAKTLFEGFQAEGVAADQVASMRSSYYATVASALLDGGNAKDAGYYLNLAHKLEPGNPDVTAVKERMK
jgi:hypothetical protein